ncbi:MAG: hypothetical protein K0R34_1813 [Herbinix sp.]|jgi:hypothetical protein|nr:hypothetical protein [Herbinix sp.]
MCELRSSSLYYTFVPRITQVQTLNNTEEPGVSTNVRTSQFFSCELMFLINSHYSLETNLT